MSNPIAVGAYRLTQPNIVGGSGSYTTPSGLTTATTGSSFLVVISTQEYKYKPNLQSDSYSNSYVQLGTDYHNGIWINAYLCINGTGGNNHAVTYDAPVFNGGDTSLHFFEITDGALSSLVDVQLISYYNGSPLIGSITTTNANDLLISVCQAPGPNYSVAGSGWTLFSGTSTARSAAAYKNRTSTGTDDPTWSTTATFSAAALVTIAFKQAAAAAALTATFTAQATVAPSLTTSIKLAATAQVVATVTATLGFLTPSFGSASAIIFSRATNPDNNAWQIPVPSGQTASDAVLLIAQNARYGAIEWPPGFNEIAQYKDYPNAVPFFGAWGNARIAIKQGNPLDSGVYAGKATRDLYTFTLAVVLVKNARKTVTPVSTYNEYISSEDADIHAFDVSNGPLSASTQSQFPLHLTLWATGGSDGDPALATSSNNLFGTRDFSCSSNVGNVGVYQNGIFIDHATSIAAASNLYALVYCQSEFVWGAGGLRSVYLPFTSSAIALWFADFSSAATVNFSLSVQTLFKANFVSPSYTDPDTGEVSYYGANFWVGDLTVRTQFASTPAAQATLAAALTTGIRFASAVVAQAAVSAALNIGVKLAMSAAGQATLTAALSSGAAAAALVAALTSSASVTAALGYLVPSIGNVTSLLVDLSTPTVHTWAVPVPTGQTYADAVLLVAVGAGGTGFTWPPGFTEIGRYETDYHAKVRFASKQGNPDDSGSYFGTKYQDVYNSLMIVAAIIKNARKKPTTIVNTYGERSAPETPDVNTTTIVSGPYSATAAWELPVALHVMGSFDQLGAAPTITSSLFGSRAAYVVQHYATLYYPDQVLALDYASPLTGSQSDTAVGTMEAGYGTTLLGFRTVYLAFESSAKAALWLDIGVRPVVTASLTAAARFKADFVSPSNYTDPETGESYYNGLNMWANLTVRTQFASTPVAQATLTAALTVGVKFAMSAYGQATLTAAFSAASVGVSAITLAAATASISATLPLVGSAAITMAGLTASASGTGIAALGGTASITLGSLTTTATGANALVSSLSKTLGVLTAASQGQVSVAAAATISLATLTSSSASQLALAAASSNTLGTLTVSAFGLKGISGSLTKTLGALTIVSAGGTLNQLGFVTMYVSVGTLSMNATSGEIQMAVST